MGKKIVESLLNNVDFHRKKTKLNNEENTAQNPLEIEKEGKKQWRTTLVLLLNVLRLI